MLYRPHRIIVESSVYDSPFTRNILASFDSVPFSRMSEEELNDQRFLQDLSLTSGKKILLIKRFKGTPIKLCPGYSDQVLCCNYYVIDLIENCPLECTYCILQAFLNRPVITLHANIEEIMDQVEEAVNNQPNRPFRIGTGEHSDSMALDNLLNANPYLVERFAKLPNATLELKTKTNHIDNLLGLNHGGRTVVAWSLNPPKVIRHQEFKTASLEERLHAAQRVNQDGYKVAFHFDPIIHYRGWEEDYYRTIDQMFTAVPPEQIAWISLGTFRYIPSLKQVSEERFPHTNIFANEFVKAADGKMRYLKSIRLELLTKVSEKISELAPNLPLYLCMEKHSVWKRFMKVQPETPEELEQYLSCNI